MDGYNNDYNKDLYTAQSSDFCKSCYSSGRSRAGCLWAVVLALGGYFIYLAAAAITGSQAAAVVITAAAAALWIYRKRRGKT